MKTNQKVIKKGNYYQLQTIEDLMIQQKLPKKQQLSVTINPNTGTNIQSSANINTSTNQLSQNIITTLPPKSTVLKNYNLPVNTKIKTDDYGLDDYQSELQRLLKMPIKDQERFQIQKILKQISEIKNSQQLPINSLPQNSKNKVKDNGVVQAPKIIDLVTEYNVQKLQNNIKQLQNIKYIQLSRLEHLVQILSKQQPHQLNSPTLNQSSTTTTSQQSPLDQKTKQQLQSLYNNLCQLKCLNNLTGIVNKISANEAKYTQMSNLVAKVQGVNDNNKDILDQLENDEMALKSLEENFKGNIKKVRQIIKKLAQ